MVRELEPFFERSGWETGTGKRETWTLLDIGTGLGDIPRAAVAAARRHGVELTPMGMDLSRTAARLARAGGLAMIVADGSWLPLGPRSVDVIVASQVLHHVPRAAAVRWHVAQRIVIAWVLTLPAAGLLGAVAFWAVSYF